MSESVQQKKQWFAVHALSQHEFKARNNMLKRLPIEEMEELIGEILIPTEKVSEVKNGKKYEMTKKFYPGYMFVNMALYDENNQIIEKTWHFIKNTPSVIGFVGGDRPVPLPQTEVDQLMMQIEEKQDRVTPKIDFDTGETVKITDGPFMNFNGIIEEIDPERGKLRVTVSIFGRDTPVDLEYWQVEKVS